MDFLAILLLIAILIIALSIKSSLGERIRQLEHEIEKLRNVIETFGKTMQRTAEQPKPAAQKPAEETYWKSGFEPVAAPAPEPVPGPLPEPAIAAAKQVEHGQVIEAPEQRRRRVAAPPKPPKPGFFERNPDLEKFIGENLISKIGIAILVLAIGYFVKFAIDNNWIGEVGRVAIGILCGGILVGLAHRLHKNYTAFSSVLVGGGLAVFYFTISLGYHQFHLFGQTIAFVIMVVITAFAVALALLYDRQEVAVIALVGGFASPFMVSDGSGNYVSLFIYLIVLNTGLLVLAYNKAWRLLNLLAFIFTVLLFAGWLLTLDAAAPNTYRNALLFATIFYLMFFAINIANNIRENKKFIASDFGILLANTALYFSVGLYCLYNFDASSYKGLFSASLGVFNLVASYFLFRNRKIDTNVLYLLIGLTLTFVSLTGPLQLEGNYITLFWASEAVLLYWLFQKSKISIIQLSSALVWTAMLISLVMDWNNVYGYASRGVPVLINKGFITTFYAAAASFVLAILHARTPIDFNARYSLVRLQATVLRAVAVVLLYLAGALELNYQFLFHYPGIKLNLLYLELYTLAFVYVLHLVGQKRAGKKTGVLVLLLTLGIGIYLLLIGTNFTIQSGSLLEHHFGAHFTVAHWLVALLTALILYAIINYVRKNETVFEKSLALVTPLLCIVAVVFVSVEIHVVIRALFYSSSNSLENISTLYIKTVLPIVWGLCSFAFMYLGMKYKFRALRVLSLVLFTVTLAKLFIFDIRNIPAGGKIAAFFCLGVLLLVVSFMYQRLKKIIIQDEVKPAD